MVSAYTFNKVLGAANPVPFEFVEANTGNMWDNITHKFTMTEVHGVFYVAMDAGLLADTALDFVLHKSEEPFARCIHNYSVRFTNGDTTARDIILSVNSDDTLHFSTNTGLYSSSWMGSVNIAIFNIAEHLSSDVDPVVFSVARSTILGETAKPVIFDVTLVNDFSLYEANSNMFIAPTSGIYFFSFSVGVAAHLPVDFTLFVNEDPITSIIRESTFHPGTEVIGRSMVVVLEEADTVYVVNQQTAWSSELLETSFAGFQYEPAHGKKVK